MRVASYTLHSPSPLFATVDNNSIQGLVIKADKLAEELANRRRYITIDTTRNIMSFDPRFLVFEFTYNLILRESQVFLLIKCMKHLVMIWRCARVFMCKMVQAPLVLRCISRSQIPIPQWLGATIYVRLKSCCALRYRCRWCKALCAACRTTRAAATR